MPAVNLKRLIRGISYKMMSWENGKPSKEICSCKIIGWFINGKEVSVPKSLVASSRDIQLHMENISSGETLVLVKDPDNGGAVFFNRKRVTFHE